MRRAMLLILLLAMLGASTCLGVAWIIGGVQPKSCAVSKVNEGMSAGWTVTHWKGRGQTIWHGYESVIYYPGTEPEGVFQLPEVPSDSMFIEPPRFEQDAALEQIVGWPIESWRVRWLGHPSFYGQHSGMDLFGGAVIAAFGEATPWSPAARILAMKPRWPGAVASAGIWSAVWAAIAGLLAIPGVVRGVFRRRWNRCNTCGYDLRGRDSAVCSECGSPRSARRPVVSTGLLIILGAALAVIAVSEVTIGTLVARMMHGHHALHFAARDGDVKAIKRALARGAPADVAVEKTKYYNGMTPLMWASAAGSDGSDPSFA